MPCYHPLEAWRSEFGGRLVFDRDKGVGQSLSIPCGQCIGCRLDRSLEWAVRISNEASLYDKNCFITLTYSPEHLPYSGSLILSDFQNFMKRLRKRFPLSSIRFFHCGEYGETTGRPHYHACLMNFDFPDKEYLRSSPRGDLLYTSKILGELWPFGLHEIGSVTFDSAAYVARYITKKVTGKLAKDHYTRVSCETGEIFELKPEYTTMSRRPGIGAPWLEKYHKDVYPHDEVILRSGAKIPPPRFFDSRYELMYPTEFAEIKEKRDFSAANMPGTSEYRKKLLENSEKRLKVRETVHKARVSQLKRSVE